MCSFNSHSEFQGKETLSNSEVYMLLERTLVERVEEKLGLSDAFVKTFHHTQKFSKFKNRETITRVKR